MSYFDSVRRSFEVLFLKKESMSALADDKDATAHGVITLIAVSIIQAIVIALVLAGLAMLFLSKDDNALPARLQLLAQQGPIVYVLIGIAFLIICLLAFFASYSILHLLAKLFGGAATGVQFFRVCANLALPLLALSVVTFILSLIPVLGSVVNLAVTIFQIVVMVNILKVVHKLSTGKAVAVIAIPLAVLFVIIVVLVVVAIIATAGFGTIPTLPT